jgi:hypothetical protein
MQLSSSPVSPVRVDEGSRSAHLAQFQRCEKQCRQMDDARETDGGSQAQLVKMVVLPKRQVDYGTTAKCAAYGSDESARFLCTKKYSTLRCPQSSVFPFFPLRVSLIFPM